MFSLKYLIAGREIRSLLLAFGLKIHRIDYLCYHSYMLQTDYFKLISDYRMTPMELVFCIKDNRYNSKTQKVLSKPKRLTSGVRGKQLTK